MNKKKNHYKPVRVSNFWNNNYNEYRFDFKINLQDSYHSLTLKLVGHVLHVRKKVTSLKHKLVMSKIIMTLLNH